MTTLENTFAKIENNTYILVETSLGNFKLQLYNETPIHRDNFLKLVEEGFYNETLFHRIIKGFMIQGGDPDSKTAVPGQQLGAGSPGYTLPAEIVYPKYFHKRGALAAARQADRVNPEKRSNGSQFYIVWGSVLTNELMDNMEKLSFETLQEQIFNRLAAENKTRANALHQQNDHTAVMQLEKELTEKAIAETKLSATLKYTDEERKTYTTLGGAPFLDKDYTVFGEVVDGLDVIEKIQLSRTAPGDRPIEDIKVRMTVVN